MNSFEKKEQNLNQLIDKLNSMSLSYSQPTSELEKIKCGVKVNKIKTKINLIAIPQKQLGDHFSQYSSNYELANL